MHVTLTVFALPHQSHPRLLGQADMFVQIFVQDVVMHDGNDCTAVGAMRTLTTSIKTRTIMITHRGMDNVNDLLKPN